MSDEEKQAKIAALQQLGQPRQPLDHDTARAVQDGFNTALNTPPTANVQPSSSLQEKLKRLFK